MPAVGVPNNPDGVNSFDHFAPEPPYGAITNAKRLAGSAPVAGGQVAAGAINAPKKSQRKSQQQGPPTPAPVPEGTPQPNPIPPPGFPPPPQQTADIWAQIASTPGASPLVMEYAAKAQQQP